MPARWMMPPPALSAAIERILPPGKCLAGTRHLDAAPAVARDAHHFVGAAAMPVEYSITHWATL